MRQNLKFFKKSKTLPVDKFFQNVLYDAKIGYYNTKIAFGKNGDFITAPNISKLFSEIIAIWIVSTWEVFGKPNNFNIVELGPGDGSLMKELLNVFQRFPKFNSVKKIFLYEKSKKLVKRQKELLKNNKISWIRSFKKIKNGPIIFFGNEFFDAIPIKQFKKNGDSLLEKFYNLGSNFKIKEVYRKASFQDIKKIRSFKTFNNLKFIEFPKSGLDELKKINKKILKLGGCILIIDYGYLKPNNQNTLQSVMRHRKNKLLSHLGQADITTQVNFNLLKEFFHQNKLKVKNIITQKDFLTNMGIMERAEIIAKKMKFSEKTNLYLRMKRLLSPRLMGSLFKVILAYKHKNNYFYGFK